MHMSCHLSECVFDYGPPHAFWLYAFERFNGVVGSLPNNNKSIEVQMINRFLTDKHVMSSSVDNQELFDEDFMRVTFHAGHHVGSLACHEPTPLLNNVIPSMENLASVLTLPKFFKRAVLDEFHLAKVTKLYSLLYSKPEADITPNMTYLEYSYLIYNGIVLGSYKSRSHNSSNVLVEWNSDLFGPDREATMQERYRPAKIVCFAKHSVVIDSKVIEHMLVFVEWYM